MRTPEQIETLAQDIVSRYPRLTIQAAKMDEKGADTLVLEDPTGEVPTAVAYRSVIEPVVRPN
jgi:hypothetical protein